MSMEKFNHIGFRFGQSMHIPLYWNNFYDYILIFTIFKLGINHIIENFYQILEKNGITAANIPQSHQLILPSLDWLQNRISIFIYELESIISDEFYPSQQPLHPIELFVYANLFFQPNMKLNQ